ncbi:RimJ/RimL family protein N-acetyltransferase [Fontibacillus phaseoli]|uniref:RimJ/RimL family protein N-acetyltransferase n=1 Tax=Fontibacillus phaseoli TaxID=1416533 RepID=A0A369BTE2_9BACL|nr:GNAT family N-acetyltransferase [Fontibacillus phaseoli]RCX23846.1 RimJ/RimL family protein N-acetyltransferase [Fontibacillus phaseoli]
MIIMETNRLWIRQHSADDLEELHCILGDADTMSFWPAPFTKEQTSSWLQKNIEAYSTLGFGRWGMVLKESGKLVGDIGFMRVELDSQLENDLGYIISSSYWGRDLGTEAAAACLEYGFSTLDMRRICANMPLEHHASRRVAEKIGMTCEKQYINQRNREKWTYLYSKSM